MQINTYLTVFSVSLCVIYFSQNPQFVAEPLAAYIVPSCDAHNSEYLAGQLNLLLLPHLHIRYINVYTLGFILLLFNQKDISLSILLSYVIVDVDMRRQYISGFTGSAGSAVITKSQVSY